MKSLREARRIVIKLGTQVVIGPDGGLARDRLRDLTARTAQLWSLGKQPLLVSSGAVGLGSRSLLLTPTARQPLTLVEKQACAAVGQTLLMDAYRQLLGTHGVKTAQLLLTAADFSDRRRYLTLRKTLEKLLTLRTVPVINENDSVSTMELEEGVYSKSFGDNDRLSALVAAKLDADLLVMLTNVDGLYTENPDKSPAARRIDRIESFQQLTRIKMEGQSAMGRGGMSSKIEAARIASISGVDTVIASALGPDPLGWLFDSGGEYPGTVILSQSSIPGKRRWIGFASGSRGAVTANAGACRALTRRQASLLPIGVVSVEGSFQSGQVIGILDERGHEVGRGVANFSSQEVQRIRGRQSSEVEQMLGGKARTEVVHRDNLVIFQEHFRDEAADQEQSQE